MSPKRAFWPVRALGLAIAFLSFSLGAGNPRFTDITGTSGVSFFHHSSPDKKFLAESMSGGVALFDYDRDGWLDIYFVHTLTVATADRPGSVRSPLFLNNRDGTFREVTDLAGVGHPGWGVGTCVGDYDADGWLDLYVTCLGPNRLYRNLGDGTFREVAEELGVGDSRWSSGCSFGDYDQDGDLDLFVANYIDFDLKNPPEFGQGPLCRYKGIPVQCGPRGLAGAGDSLYENQGNGTFREVSERAGVNDSEGYDGLGVIWSDFDQDGWIDLFVANDSKPNFLYVNQRNGTFRELGFLSGTAVDRDGNDQASMGIALGDYDRDGDLDLFVTNFSEEPNTLYRSDGKLLFSDVSTASRTAEISFPLVGWGVDFIDYDNDGWLDLLAVNGHVYPQLENSDSGLGYAQRKLFFRNNRDSTFTESAVEVGEVLLEERVSRGLAVGDIDNDGDLDAVINELDGSSMLLRNDGGNLHNWIRVRLEGSRLNPFAIGARVRITAAGMTQVSEVRSGGSYLSQHDLRLHFGLGDAAAVDRIEVAWPAGGITRLQNVAANREVVVRYDPDLKGSKESAADGRP